MPSIRLSAVHVLILASLPLAGCSYSRDAYLPAGTEAVVSDSDTGGVTAFVPPNQQNKVPRDSIILGNETPVVVVDDPYFRTAMNGQMRNALPMDRVRVRIVKGHQEIEVVVRRRELAPRPIAAAWAISFVPAAVLLLFAAAGVLWMIESIVLLCVRIRSDRTELHLGLLPLQTLVTVLLRARRRAHLIERTDEECEQWREWIAERTARRKAICTRLRERRLQNGSRVW
jgi:hypothetical protein